MEKLSRKIVQLRVPIFLVSLLLLIPAALGYIHTRVNYDILSYLPEDIETMKGQDILVDEFGTGGYSMFICRGMQNKDVAKLKGQIQEVPHVARVLWYDDVMDISVPLEMLPENIREVFNSGDSTLMFIIFDTTTSADETMDAIGEIRSLAGKQCFLSGMSAVVTDTRDLAESEVFIYVVIAAALSTIVLALTMESYLIPVFFLLSIGMAILYNLGSNVFLGEISYITQALTAVLQLGVTMDYSIFLWHSYQEKVQLYPDNHREAMAQAIPATIKSVVGSSITTVAGFVALCFMSFTLGLDLGVVMAKGVVIGVICCVTVLPSMILIFDKPLEKTKHRKLLPEPAGLSRFIVKHHSVFAALFLVLLIPFAWFQSQTEVYYNLDATLPEELPSIQANSLLEEEFHLGAVHMLLLDKDVESKEIYQMIDRMEQVDGVKQVLGLESVVGPAIPDSMIPEELKSTLESEHYRLMLILNDYPVASDQVNRQISQLNEILKDYDPEGMLVGEAPCTKDLITITDKDFQVVSAISIAAVFLIILCVFKSISLPVILVLVIEGAIFINMGIPYLTGTQLPFVASIVIGTIQLGATVDYAILMTSRYEAERGAGRTKREAISIAHKTSVQTVMVSALSFFAATFGVGVYSQIDMISSLCLLMARGAIISMLAVLLFLPAMFWIFDGAICKTSKNFRQKGRNQV
ncbi:MAG TPA: MMPL family transporter [Candidatus Egerieimonas intestinavium]|uniref:MMPL family transporter n=1 Tax=Candidatus Egerieimonas intestinavium TaxID=2840777 RepID=A0A9D1EK22_9FIRM|nr:MMPL family transporter [Candidatus Egerieimonas intestinavium]